MRARSEILREIASLAAAAELEVGVPITEELRLVDDFGLDSMKALALMVEIENRFEVVIDPSDESQLETVGDLVTLLESKLEAG